MDKINLERFKPFQQIRSDGLITINLREQRIFELAEKINEIIDYCNKNYSDKEYIAKIINH